MNTTLADLVISAQAAAQTALAAPDALAQQTTKLEAFATANFDRADFGTWENSFHAQLEMLQAFTKQDSPATFAAKKAAAERRAPPRPASVPLSPAAPGTPNATTAKPA